MEQEILMALDVLKSGGIILYPTDTVWGLGCDATNAEAVAKIFALKQRADNKSMIILLDEADSVPRYVRQVPDVAWELWEVSDKPLTLILPEGVGLAPNLLPQEKSVAIRLVGNDFCRRLIHKLRRPLVSTSANISGEPSPLTFEQISEPIKAGVDYVVGPAMEQADATHSPSSIIRLGLGGQIEIIRK
ncbi:MAG: L-threonylcarbamoyladenylate synthase [Mucinivorans sp.]